MRKHGSLFYLSLLFCRRSICAIRITSWSSRSFNTGHTNFLSWGFTWNIRFMNSKRSWPLSRISKEWGKVSLLTWLLFRQSFNAIILLALHEATIIWIVNFCMEPSVRVFIFVYNIGHIFMIIIYWNYRRFPIIIFIYRCLITLTFLLFGIFLIKFSIYFPITPLIIFVIFDHIPPFLHSLLSFIIALCAVVCTFRHDMGMDSVFHG